MPKGYVRLKDKGSTFYDMEKQQSVVGDRVALVDLTGTVAQAIADNRLEKLEKSEGERIYKEQMTALRKTNPAMAETIYGPEEKTKKEAKENEALSSATGTAGLGEGEGGTPEGGEEEEDDDQGQAKATKSTRKK